MQTESGWNIYLLLVIVIGTGVGLLLLAKLGEKLAGHYAAYKEKREIKVKQDF